MLPLTSTATTSSSGTSSDAKFEIVCCRLVLEDAECAPRQLRHVLPRRLVGHRDRDLHGIDVHRVRERQPVRPQNPDDALSRRRRHDHAHLMRAHVRARLPLTLERRRHHFAHLSAIHEEGHALGGFRRVDRGAKRREAAQVGARFRSGDGHLRRGWHRRRLCARGSGGHEKPCEQQSPPHRGPSSGVAGDVVDRHERAVHDGGSRHVVFDALDGHAARGGAQGTSSRPESEIHTPSLNSSAPDASTLRVRVAGTPSSPSTLATWTFKSGNTPAIIPSCGRPASSRHQLGCIHRVHTHPTICRPDAPQASRSTPGAPPPSSRNSPSENMRSTSSADP